MFVCLSCSAEFTATRYEKSRKFCSLSCAAKHNNRSRPKKHSCQRCGDPVPWNRKFCSDDCRWPGRQATKTKGDLRHMRSFQVHSRIRSLARASYKKSGRPLECFICGYDKHYDVCHILPIKDYPDETLISEINREENLVALCKNHHWELDNGILNWRDTMDLHHSFLV